MRAHKFVSVLLSLTVVSLMQSGSHLHAAQPQITGAHHARLSWVVQKFLSQSGAPTTPGHTSSMPVILNGPSDVMDRIEHQYNLHRKATLDTGAVFDATPDQISQVSLDAQVDTVAEDGLVQA